MYVYADTQSTIVIVSIVFCSLYNVFTAIFEYMTSVWFLICIKMCPYACTRAESIGYCVAVSIVSVCAVYGAVLNFSLR